MVSPDRTRSTVSDDRGQLILVGAIAMALIVIGLVLVVNTALFTQVVGPEGTVEGAKGAGVASEEIEDSVGQVVHEENVDPSTNTPAQWSDVGTAVEGDLTGLLLNRSLDGQGAYLSVSLGSSSDVEEGTLFYQVDNRSFPTSDAVPTTGDANVSHFDLGVETGSGNVTVEVTGDSGPPQTVTIDARGTSRVVVDPSTGPACTVDGVSGLVWIDLRRGVDYTGQCHFDLFQSLDSPYVVEFQYPDATTATGQFQIVTDEDPAVGDVPCGSTLYTDCKDAVWEYRISYTYETVETTIEADSVEVPVYD